MDNTQKPIRIQFKNVKETEEWANEEKITLSSSIDGRSAGFITIPTKNISVETLVCLSKIITKIDEEEFSQMLTDGDLIIEVYLSNYTQLFIKRNIGDHVDEPYCFFKP